MSTTVLGKPVARVDGRLKVTGAARYAAEVALPNQAYAVIVGATVGLGRVTAVDAAPVSRMPGVLAVLSHLDAPRLAYRPHKGPIDPSEGERLHVLQDDRVRFFGQPVAVVVADTLERAEHAAAALVVRYAAEPPAVSLGDPRAGAVAPAAGRGTADHARGDAERALAEAAVTVDAAYEMARENHVPIEPNATVAAWEGDRLTLWSKSQYVVNEQAELAAIFGLPAEHVRVVCPFVGGGFGTSLRTWPHVTLAALAARRVGRPVKLVLTRRQTFHLTGHRPHTVQRIALGAGRDGRLTAILHDGTGETSRYEEFVEALTSVTSFLYASPNVRTRYRLVPLDTSTPTYMRGPGEASNVFALESAMDELAYALSIDPVELRRRNEPAIDEGEGRPFSSRSLLQCYALGAERFGWDRRDPAPRSMRDGRLLVGWGMASASYPAFHNRASARVRLGADGAAAIETAASDMGPGTYTSLSQVAAAALGLPLEQVRIEIGASDFPPTPPHGGSQTMASVGTAVHDACRAAQASIAERLPAVDGSPFAGVPPEALAWSEGRIGRRDGIGPVLDYAEAVRRLGGGAVEATATASRDPEAARRYSMHAFGAVFAEVVIDPDVLTIAVRRMVGAYGAGRIVNPRLARSQCTGGMVGGIGMALMERTVLDPRDGRPVNAHMGDYLVPVNLDIGRLEAHFVDEADPHVNPLGIKGLGEIALVGVAPAIANAVFHATGRRLRHLPIRLEDLLEA